MSALIKYDQARQALAACRNVDDIKDIRDKSEAMRLYAKQANDTELEQWAAEIKLRAQRAIGEISVGLEKQKNQAALPSGGKSKNEALKDAGISTSTAHRYEQLAAIPVADVEALIAKHKEIGKPVSAKAVLATLTKPVDPPARPVDTSVDTPPANHGDAPDFGMAATAVPASAPPEPAPEPLEDPDDNAPDPFELLREEQAKVEVLHDQVDTLTARVKMLSQGDLAAQIIAIEQDRDGIRNRAAMHYEDFTKANNKVIQYKKILDKLCKLAGVTKYTDLSSRIIPRNEG